MNLLLSMIYSLRHSHERGFALCNVPGQCLGSEAVDHDQAHDGDAGTRQNVGRHLWDNPNVYPTASSLVSINFNGRETKVRRNYEKEHFF